MQDAERDYQLGQRRMRIEERLAVQVVTALRDEMDLVENDLGDGCDKCQKRVIAATISRIEIMIVSVAIHGGADASSST